MSVVSERVQHYLDDHFICYETVPHVTDFTASETAEHTHTPGRRFAKAVVITVDDEPAMVVLPAHHVVDLEELRQALGAGQVQICGERTVRRLFRDCDVGAVPPFGNLYGMEVFVSPRFNPGEITFNAGSHEMVIRMSFRDYCKLVRPTVVDFSHRP